MGACALGLACSSTEDAGELAPECEPSLESIRSKIFAESCTQPTCHGAVESAAALNLEDPNLEAQLIGIGAGTCDGRIRVVPGSPDESLLVEKLANDTPSCGDRMPIIGALSAAEIACVRDWIATLKPSDPPPCETCGGTNCVFLQTDSKNCGRCGNVCPSNGACWDGECLCLSTQENCGDVCADLLTDPTHCGDCATTCAAGASCVDGACVCPGGLLDCGGGCVDPTSDGGHCGGCGNACPGGQVCLNGACSDGCGALLQCGNSCVDPQTSLTDCGGCSNVCPAGAQCLGGACQCAPGFAACGGVCIDVSADPSNCGACGVTCGTGQVCSAGACGCASTAPVSFGAQVQPILSASCAVLGCHSGVKPKEDLSLLPGQSYGELVNVPSNQCNGRVLVVPGDTAGSYLMSKLTNNGICTGTQMPKAGFGLPPAQIQLIADWVCLGAPAN